LLVIRNPNNLSTEDIKCDDIVQQNLADVDEELRQYLIKISSDNANKIDCLINKYHENQFLNKTFAIAMLEELALTDDQKTIERNQFIQSMTKITSDLSVGRS